MARCIGSMAWVTGRLKGRSELVNVGASPNKDAESRERRRQSREANPGRKTLASAPKSGFRVVNVSVSPKGSHRAPSPTGLVPKLANGLKRAGFREVGESCPFCFDGSRGLSAVLELLEVLDLFGVGVRAGVSGVYGAVVVVVPRHGPRPQVRRQRQVGGVGSVEFGADRRVGREVFDGDGYFIRNPEADLLGVLDLSE